MWYAGADLSRRSVMVAMVDDRSRRVQPRRLECREPERIVKLMLDHRPFKVVIEASGSYRWLYDLLAPHGEVVLAHPLRLKAIWSGRAKTDKVDGTQEPEGCESACRCNTEVDWCMSPEARDVCPVMTDQELAERLLSDAGPALRYRTARDLLPDPPKRQMDAYRRELVRDAEVRTWLARLDRCQHMHNGMNDRFENILGRLTDLGLDRTFAELERLLRRFRAMLAGSAPHDVKGMWQNLNTVILAIGLARAGYTDDEVVVSTARARFSDVCQAIRQMIFDALYPVDAEPKKPRHFRSKRVVRREYAPNGVCLLPYVYDLHLAAAFPPGALGSETEGHVKEIVRHVLHPGYQRLPDGYGILIEDHDGTTRYYAVGWNVALPGFFGKEYTAREAKALLLRLEMMSTFAEGRQSEWFRRSLRHLESFRPADGGYLRAGRSNTLPPYQQEWWLRIRGGAHVESKAAASTVMHPLGVRLREPALPATHRFGSLGHCGEDRKAGW